MMLYGERQSRNFVRNTPPLGTPSKKHRSPHRERRPPTDGAFPTSSRRRNLAGDMLKTHSTVQLSSANRAKPPNELNDRPKFNVVIIYEDRAAGRRAKHFYDNLIHELEDECDFCLDLWNFQVLAISAIWDSAVQVAGQADFVILSLHGKAGLPVEIGELIKTWTRHISDSN